MLESRVLCPGPVPGWPARAPVGAGGPTVQVLKTQGPKRSGPPARLTRLSDLSFVNILSSNSGNWGSVKIKDPGLRRFFCV